jgi:hypothetical protein
MPVTEILFSRFLNIEMKDGGPVCLIRAVTGETFVGENRADIAIELDRLGQGCRSVLSMGGGCQQQRAEPHAAPEQLRCVHSSSPSFATSRMAVLVYN